jgi:hypothetical protein
MEGTICGVQREHHKWYTCCMSRTTRGAVATRHLSLVPGRDQARDAWCPRAQLSLRGAPYRPGEMPTALSLRIGEDLARTLNEQAQSRRVPVELWIRSAVDAARAVGSLSSVAAVCPAAIVAELDQRAEEFQPIIAGDIELLEYRRLLLRGEPGSVTRVPASGNVELLVPADLGIAWRREAAVGGADLDRWTTTLLQSAPSTALSWEAAAAGSGERLAEWVYASWLRRSVRSSA